MAVFVAESFFLLWLWSRIKNSRFLGVIFTHVFPKKHLKTGSGQFKALALGLLWANFGPKMAQNRPPGTQKWSFLTCQKMVIFSCFLVFFRYPENIINNYITVPLHVIMCIKTLKTRINKKCVFLMKKWSFLTCAKNGQNRKNLIFVTWCWYLATFCKTNWWLNYHMF